MRRRTSADEESISIDEFDEGVSDRISGTTDSDRLHHSGIPELTTAQLAIKHLKLFKQEMISLQGMGVKNLII